MEYVDTENKCLQYMKVQGRKAAQTLTCAGLVSEGFSVRGQSTPLTLQSSQLALQGTVDYVYNPDGWYAGSFISNVKFVKDVGGDANVEIDLYGGKRGSINGRTRPDITSFVLVMRQKPSK